MLGVCIGSFSWAELKDGCAWMYQCEVSVYRYGVHLPGIYLVVVHMEF